MTLAINHKKTAQLGKSPSRIMLFDLALGGHHGNYIRYLIEFWLENQLAGSLDIVVLPQFLQFHQDVVATIPKGDRHRIKITAIKTEEAAVLKSRSSFKERTWRNFQEWSLLCHYAKTYQATECLVMYFDTCELPLATGRPAPCPVSGIYFKPTFHYCHFPGDRPTRKEIIQRWREKLTLSRILRHPQLKTLFCLDPLAIEPLKQFNPQARVVYVADPVELKRQESIQPQQDLAKLREKLKIDSDRIIMLFFGAIDGRKGIYQSIQALLQLPTEIKQKICLLVVGATNKDDGKAISLQLASLRETIQIIENYQFIAESEVPIYFQLADLVLAPYQKHIGMSGILLLAAAAGKPVLSSDYGLMGQMVQQYSLGLSIDTTIPEEIALAITQFILTYPHPVGNAVKRQQFAREHSVQDYAETIVQHLNLNHV